MRLKEVHGNSRIIQEIFGGHSDEIDTLPRRRYWRHQDLVSRSRPARRSNIVVAARVSERRAHVPRFDSASRRQLSPYSAGLAGLWAIGPASARCVQLHIRE